MSNYEGSHPFGVFSTFCSGEGNIAKILIDQNKTIEKLAKSVQDNGDSVGSLALIVIGLGVLGYVGYKTISNKIENERKNRIALECRLADLESQNSEEDFSD